MKKPYLKKIGEYKEHSVYYVDGPYIRANIEEEFTNFAQHYRFKFIPENEFWIDLEFGKKEWKYFAKHLYHESQLMKSGKTYVEAIDEADKIEQVERNKSPVIKKIKKLSNKSIIKKIHKRQLKQFSNEKINVWIVNGFLVRSLFFIDYTEGGHDKIYDFIPPGEVWIDDAINPKEIDFVLLHELYERRSMINDKINLLKKESYNQAHAQASELEFLFRKNPKNIKKEIKQELNLNLKEEEVINP